ncbi:MAG: DUF5119 domain-containing protein [Bacteroides sp.]|nr:DUF5119 domain-containing protein [Bacteroides sp.]
MNRILSMMGLFFMLTAMVSCNHKELCYDHEPHAERVEYKLELSFDCEWEYNIESNVDWEQQWKPEYGISYDDIRPKEPEGVRVHVFNEDNQTETVRNLTKQNSTIRFTEEGHYDLLFYNNDTEYIVFEGLESFNSATATTRGSSRSRVMNAPDMLFGAYMDSIFVEKSSKTETMKVTLKPLVYTYLMRYEFAERADEIVSANGALDGVACKVNLSNGRTTPDAATIGYECQVGDYGVQALVRSFGIPDYPNPNYSRNEQKYITYLEVRLKDGKTKTFKFDITEQMAKQPHGGVILIQDIQMNDTTGGGFDVGVDGWGDVVDVPLN